MKYKQRCLLRFALVLQASIGLAQTDWQAVKDLPAESPIVVNLKNARGFRECWFQKATDDDLTCDRDNYDPHRVIYRRDEVRKVYRKPEPFSQRPSSPPFGVAGAVVGSVPALILLPTPAALGIVGGMFGTVLATKHFNHGNLVYRSSSPTANRPGKTQPSGTRNLGADAEPTVQR